MTERRKLSLGAVAERAERPAADPARGWKISASRAAALKDRARDMRRNPSPAQVLLWERLKDKRAGGFTFNREVVMGSAIVDFACKPRWLVVEVSGTGESDATLAALSDRKLTEVGVRVLRFAAEEVEQNIEQVVAAIIEELAKPFEKPAAQTNRSHAAARPERTYARDQ